MSFLNFFNKTANESGKGIVFDTVNSFWGKKIDDSKVDDNLMVQYKSAYLNFPLVHAQIETVVSHTIQDFYFEGPNKDKLMKFKNEEDLPKFFAQIDRLENIYGFVPVEIVPQPKKEFPTLKILPSKGFTIYREPTGDDTGYSLGKVLWGSTGNKSKDRNFKTRASLKDIVIFRRVVLGLDDKYGTSRVNSLLTSVRQKEQNEANVAVALERYANPIIDLSIGNENYSPSETDVDNIKSSLENLKNNSEFVHSWLIKAEILGFDGKGMDTEPILKNIDQQIISGGMVPPVLLGIQGISDKGAEIQLRSFGRHIKFEQQSLAIQFEENIIQKLKLGGEEDKLIWGKVEERETQADFDTIVALRGAGILTPQKANDLLPPKFREALPDELANPDKMLMEQQANSISGGNTDPTKLNGKPKSAQSVKVDDKNGQKAKQPKVKKDGVPR